MHPGDIYLLAIVATALFVAPWHPLARIIILVWMGIHAIWLNTHELLPYGEAEMWLNLVGHTAVVWFGHKKCLTSFCMGAWATAGVMVAVDCLRVVAWVVSTPAEFGPLRELFWAVILVLALAQLALLPFGVNWYRVRHLLSELRSSQEYNGFLRGVA